MKNNKIDYLQFCGMQIMLILTTFLGIGVYSIIKSSAVDSYISVILATIVGIIFIPIFIYLFNYEPDLPLNLKINKMLGKYLGTFANIILFIITIIFGISIMYNLINFIISQFLSETPYIIVAMSFSLIIVYINIKGLKVISRVSLILVILNMILFSTAFISLIPGIKVSNFMPVLAKGIGLPFKGVFYLITLNINSMFLLLIVPKNSIIKNKNYKKYITISYFIACLIMFLVILGIIGVLGIHLASFYQYPEYMVLKRINIFNFLDRIENIIIVQWIFGAFICLSLVIYYLCNTIKNNANSKLLTIITTSTILILSLIIFKNNTEYNNFSYNIMPYIRLILVFFNISSCILIFFKKRKQQVTN